MNLAIWLRRIAAVTPDRPALFVGERQVADYGAFHEYAARVAGALIARGIGPGDRVAIFMKNVPEYLIVQYGIWYAGAVAVPVNAKLHGKELAWIAGNAAAALIFATPELAADLAEIELKCPVDDHARDARGDVAVLSG